MTPEELDALTKQAEQRVSDHLVNRVPGVSGLIVLFSGVEGDRYAIGWTSNSEERDPVLLLQGIADAICQSEGVNR